MFRRPLPQNKVASVTRRLPTIHPRWSLLACCIVIMLAACGEDATAPQNAPAGHTVVKDGIAHAPGLMDPVGDCTACHGADLRGGTNGQPSCFSCHGQKWP